MRFEVPQFIDVEDKIFGPLTFKQFVYLIGGGSLAYASYKIIPFPIWPIVSIAFIALGLALAFYKLNNRSFIDVAQSWISFMVKGKIYIWKRVPVKPKPAAPVKPADIPVPKPQQATMKSIEELAKNLDILDQ